MFILEQNSLFQKCELLNLLHRYWTCVKRCICRMVCTFFFFGLFWILSNKNETSAAFQWSRNHVFICVGFKMLAWWLRSRGDLQLVITEVYEMKRTDIYFLQCKHTCIFKTPDKWCVLFFLLFFFFFCSVRLNGRFVYVWKPGRYEGGGPICDQAGWGGGAVKTACSCCQLFLDVRKWVWSHNDSPDYNRIDT